MNLNILAQYPKLIFENCQASRVGSDKGGRATQWLVDLRVGPVIIFKFSIAMPNERSIMDVLLIYA